MSKGGGLMNWILAVGVVLIAALLLWFSVPYSPAQTEFKRLVERQNQALGSPAGVFTGADMAALPPPVQRYMQTCGFIGTPKMSNMQIIHHDVDFILNDRPLQIQCLQYNSAQRPERMALITTRLYGIPFEGIDAYQEGAGSMKGIIAKNITLFHQTGAAMDQSSLVNCLAESLLVPSLALQDFITWESIDADRARATITYYGLSASGIFEFDREGLMQRFTTADRRYVDTSGNVQVVNWSAICGDYQEVDGIKHPRRLQAVWHLDSGDLVYFDGRATEIHYDVPNRF